MTTQIAGHLLVDCLIAQGVTHAFGVPGESYLAVLDGFHDRADRIRFVTNRQEGGAAFMSEAQGKLTGRPGVCFVTRGPGATNASIGLHTAFQDSTPMVLFVGDVASDARDREAFQEVDYNAFFGPVPNYYVYGPTTFYLDGASGWSLRVMGPDQDWDLVGYAPDNDTIVPQNGQYDATNGTISNGDLLRSGGGIDFFR